MPFPGLPILFTRYWIAGAALYRRRGPLWITEDWLPLYRVLDVRVRKSPLHLLLGLGTVVVYAADVTDAELRLKGIRQPDQVAGMILMWASELRTAYGVRGWELYGTFTGEFGHGGF